MSQLVIGTATLRCSKGTSTSALVVTPHSAIAGASNAVATIQDYRPGENIQPFGLCTSPANPLVLAAKAPQPCVPAVSAPWAPGSRGVNVAGQPALTTDSTCSCRWAGTIAVAAVGQQSIYVGDGLARLSAASAESPARVGARIAAPARGPGATAVSGADAGPSDDAGGAAEGEEEEVIEQSFMLVGEDGLPAEGYCYDLFHGDALHTQAASLSNGETVAVAGDGEIRLVAWIRRDAARRA